MKKNEFIIEEKTDFIDFLLSKNFSRNKAKSLVKYRAVYVNNKLLEKLPYTLIKGDRLVIDNNKNAINIDIIYEDKNYLIVNKEAGLLTISTSSLGKKTEDTLYKEVRSYLNSKKEYAFIVNRIDKETSGLVMFVKNEKLKNKLQNNWNSIVKARKYIALVSGKINKSGRIDNYLYEDKKTFTHSTNIAGKRAITNYKPLKFNNKYTLLDVNIETGRKNQIRVHMSEMNHPIVGDKKYYSKDNSFKRLMLHHYEISLIDPLTNKELTFKTDIPKEFNVLFNNN